MLAVVVALSAVWPAGTASAQALIADQQAVFLAPVEGGPINSPDLFGAAPEDVAPGTPVWGVIKADIDFLFLQPVFPSRAVTLNVPTPAGGAVLGHSSNLSNDFTFNPGFEIGYQFKNTGFGIQATGRLLHLTGRLERTIHDSATGAIAQASANATVDLGIVNPIEGFVEFALADWKECHHPYLAETTFVFTLGGRYAHVNQVYTSTVVTAPDHQGTLAANQTFDGFGPTSSIMGIYPVAERWALYSNVRGSLLIGENARNSSITVAAPGANLARKLTEESTDVIPTIEFEAGVMYGIPLNRPGPSPNLAPLLWVKTGFVGQIWGDLGLLPITEANGNRFSDSSLMLFGFSVQIGLDY